MKIVTDSAADLTPSDVAENGITVVPQLIRFPEGEVNSTDIEADVFYNRLEAMSPHIPTTSQPSPGIFTEVFESIAREGHDVLAIHISSGLSGTVQSSRLAATQVPDSKPQVVDCLTLSGGQRFQVLAAAAAIRAGWTMESILAMLKRMQQQCEVVFTLDTLDYLARGGRIGRVEAVAGALLHIKPVINVHKGDGKYSTVGKARTLARAEAIITDHLVQMYGNQPLWVSVMHGRFVQHAELLAQTLRERLQVAKCEILRISPVLGVHTGPAVVGAAVVPMSVLEGLKV